MIEDFFSQYLQFVHCLLLYTSGPYGRHIHFRSLVSPNVAVEWLVLLFLTEEVASSNLGPETDCSGLTTVAY
jgi:hypothetical protein